MYPKEILHRSCGACQGDTPISQPNKALRILAKLIARHLVNKKLGSGWRSSGDREDVAAAEDES